MCRVAYRAHDDDATRALRGAASGGWATARGEKWPRCQREKRFRSLTSVVLRSYVEWIPKYSHICGTTTLTALTQTDSQTPRVRRVRHSDSRYQCSRRSDVARSACAVSRSGQFCTDGLPPPQLRLSPPRAGSVARSARAPAGMGSDSDSESDSDDCLVYKTVRPVVWSDEEEEEKPKANEGAGTRRDRVVADDSDVEVCATSASVRKRARTAHTATTSNTDVVEIEDEAPPSAADAFLAPPPSAPVFVLSYDSATLHSVYASRARVEELRRAATATVEEPEIIETPIVPAPASLLVAGHGATTGAAGTNAISGKFLTLVFQSPRGDRFAFSCSETSAFSKIVADFFLTEDGESLRPKLGNPPKLVFDGEVVSAESTTPKDLDMEDEDVMDLK